MARSLLNVVEGFCKDAKACIRIMEKLMCFGIQGK